jgi:LDH2 family malate/lactate/ureidoglycolate dehydrogenase
MNPAEDPDGDWVSYSLAEVELFCRSVLTRHGLHPGQADALARVLTAGERDECRSHGLYRLPGCVRTVKSPKFNRAAAPRVTSSEGPVVRCDADYGFSCLAFETALPVAAAHARTHGMAALIINHCYHFSALWYEVEELAKNGLVALAMNPSQRSVAPAGGRKPLLGTNPFAFAWPRPSGPPYVFDFATSEVARGEIELHRQDGKPIPLGWALDKAGEPTTDPVAALGGAMIAFGGYKGSALSIMIELLAGPLINDMMSFESTDFDAGAGAAPCHGELIVVFDPVRLLGDDHAAATARAEQLFQEISVQGARLASERRYRARKHSEAHGVRIPRIQDDLLKQLLAPETAS